MEQGVVSKIRRLLPEERSSFKRADKTEWVQLCPFCDVWVGSLVDHVKTAHSDRSSRQIRTLCPYDECGKMVVDVKNHIKMVHEKVRNFKCEHCLSAFTSNHQMIKHVEAVHTNLKVECAECGGVFKTTTLQSHVRRIHRGIKPALPCTEAACEKVFGSKADMERHVLGVHMKWKAPCPECGKKIRMEQLMNHIKSAHMGMHNIKCKQCGQGFQTQKCLDQHVRVKHRGTFLYCKATRKNGLECGKVLFSEEGLINHVECKHMSGPNNVQVVCPDCSTRVPSCYLLRHITSVHTNLGLVECVVKKCGVRKSDCTGLRQHVDTDHHPLGLEWCQECNQFVLQLREHIKLQHEAELPFQPIYGVCEGQECGWEGCTFMASSETHLAGHVRTKHQKIACVKCEDCGKKVKDLEEHVRVKHDKAKTLPCDLCDKFFLTKPLLKKHKKKHNQGKQMCNECGVAVMNMRQHKRFVHEKDLPFKCEEPGCKTRFTSNCSLKNHIERVHQMVRDECNICQKQVTDLKSHIKIVHDKIREHQCLECYKNFQTRTHLLNHISRVHLGLREECPQCGKMVQDVKNHINFVHNKVANFPCDQCSTKCVTSTALKMHISSVHLKEKINCPECGILVAYAHLAVHVGRKHSDKVKVKFTCTHCEKFFPTRGQLAKHVMRVHMGVREKCTICGLLTKDLKRHTMYTNCSREGYVPRVSEESAVNTEDEVASGSLENCDLRSVNQDKIHEGISFKNEVKNEACDHVENKVLHTATIESDNFDMRIKSDLLVINNNMDTNTGLWKQSE